MCSACTQGCSELLQMPHSTAALQSSCRVDTLQHRANFSLILLDIVISIKQPLNILCSQFKISAPGWSKLSRHTEKNRFHNLQILYDKGTEITNLPQATPDANVWVEMLFRYLKQGVQAKAYHLTGLFLASFLSNLPKWNKFSPFMFMLFTQSFFDIKDTDEDGK